MIRLLAAIATTFLLLQNRLPAAEPQVPGRQIGFVTSTEAGILVIEYSSNKKAHKGDTLYVEWGSGSFFTQVLAAHRNMLSVSYTPSSTNVELGATVKVTQ